MFYLVNYPVFAKMQTRTCGWNVVSNTLVLLLMMPVVQKSYIAFGSSEGTEYIMPNTRRADLSKVGCLPRSQNN